MNIITWFCYNSFLAGSSHSYYSRGKFEIEYEDSIGDTGKKKENTKANELNLIVANERCPEDNIILSLLF